MHSPEIALTESRALRDQHSTRTDALDHFTEFTLPPGRDRLTADEVAQGFGVTRNSIDQMVSAHRDELTSNGYTKISKGDSNSVGLTEFFPARGPQVLHTFDRRAVLNVAMLLRDSEIARAVRKYLLNAEELASSSVRSAALSLLTPAEYRELACSGVTRLPDGTELSPKEARKERSLGRRRETERKVRERSQIPSGFKWAPAVSDWFKRNDGATAEQIVKHALRSLGSTASVADVQIAFDTAKAFLRSDVAEAAYEDRFGSTRFGIDLAFSLSEKSMERYQEMQGRMDRQLNRQKDDGAYGA